MNEQELIELSIEWFNNIQEMTKRITSGNVSHEARTIEGFAKRCAEFLNKHKNDERI